MRLLRSLSSTLCGFAVFAAGLAAQTPVVSYSGETMRLASASVAAGSGGSWNLTLQMANDNNNGSLPSTWRRWWHCQVANLVPGTTLNFNVTNAGYTDVILPVWSLSSDGVNFGDYTRMPTSAVPQVIGGTQHRFSVVVPAGTVAMRVAKYFPYTVTRKNALLLAMAGHPRVRSITTIGLSQQGRQIQMLELTDPTVPDAQKERIWIHSGVHPAETTAYLTMQGLLEWLTSGDPYAELLLDHAIIDVVPMPNPDGVWLGNYRANANSVEIESQWSAPYTSTQPEVVALRTRIESYMGTPQNPGLNPIRVLLNLHSSHGVSFPFHFQHTSNPSWSPGCSSCGVLPVVNQAEAQWISMFEARSQFVDIGTTQSSTLGNRPYVESMAHDRWTSQNGWLNAPNFLPPVMAITFEGTYGKGPDGVTWNTEADYLQCGHEMGLALLDYLGLGLTASSSAYGAPCTATTLACSLAPQPNGSHVANLTVANGAPGGFAFLVVGTQQVLLPLPAPWVNCALLASPEATAGFFLDGAGATTIALPVPAVAGLFAYLQAVTLDLSLALDASNGVFLQNDY
ncbi:MAG: M14 family zinc carboxypeptidase [Planctomycetota bacterium]